MPSDADVPVLVIFPGALGDIILALPAIEAISRAHAFAPLELMARAELVRLLAGRSAVSRGHSIDRQDVAKLFNPVHSGADGFFSRFRAIESFFAGDDANFRANLQAVSGGAVRFHAFRPSGAGHISQLYLDSVGFPEAAANPKIRLLDTDFENARSVLKSLGISAESKFVAIFPGSGSAAKNWPLENFLALARSLPEKVVPLAILGPAEASIADSFTRAEIATISNAEPATVGAIARMSAAFVGNDSGVSHLASACGARGVAIFGASDPSRWRPLGDVAVIHRDPIAAITVAEVARAIAAITGRAARVTI